MSEPKPKAREGLLTHDHSKRGRRLVTILNPLHGRVTLLEPWEHAVLVLCDGTHTPRQMLDVLDHPIEGETVDLKSVQRALRFFEQQDVIEPIGLVKQEEQRTPGARTLAGLQQAYREWHKDPAKTGQILSGVLPLPYPDPSNMKVPIGLDPTVALPEDEEKPRHPVAIGTTLVVGDLSDEPDGRAMKSLLQKQDEPSTMVGSLAGDGQAEVAAGEFEEDELELGGKLSDLLAAVDNDFAEVEKREREREAKNKTDRPKAKKAPPPVGRPIAGVAEVPRAKSLAKPNANVWLAEMDEKPATRVITDPDQPMPARPNVLRAPTLPPGIDVAETAVTDEPTMRSIVYSEAALRPTMVGIPADEGDEPVLLVPPRSASRADDWVGAVVAAEHIPAQRNVATIEDTLPYLEMQTEGGVDPEDPLNGHPNTEPFVKARDDNPTTTAGTEHIAPGRAREVFERLRKAGLKARSYSDEALDEPRGDEHLARRKDDKAARRFEQALVSLTAGDLGLALAHFRALFDQMPDSKRLRGFIDAIESVRDEQQFQPSILEDFEAALEDAIAYGRCPKCFSMMAPDEGECFACGFRLSRTI